MKCISVLRPVPQNDPSHLKGHFPRHAFEHSGRMRVTLIENILEYYADEIEIIGEPMIGTGSVCVAAAPREILVYGCEYDEVWAEVARRTSQNAGCISSIWSGRSEECPPMRSQRYDTLLTSPPFPNAHTQGSSAMQDAMREDKSTYAGNAFALHKEWGCGSNPNPKKWKGMLRKILSAWVHSLVSKGLVLIHIKDYTRKGEKVDVGEWVAEVMEDVDIEPHGFHVAPLDYTSGFQTWLKYHRRKVVEWKDEVTVLLECGDTKTYSKPPKKKPSAPVCTGCEKEDWVEIKEERIIVGRKL